MRSIAIFPAIAVLALAAPAAAQEAGEAPPPPLQESGDPRGSDFLTVGLGAALVPSYDGSNDYSVIVLPLVQGSVGGIDISPRPGGLAFDFVSDSGADLQFGLGPSFRVRTGRGSDPKDEVVALLPEHDTAWEVGVWGGVSLAGALNPYDSLSLETDFRWDVAGAHDGMVVAPTLSYVTPLSEGIAAILAIGGEYADDDFMDYYYSVGAADAALTGLPEFQAEGAFRSVGAQLLLGFDLSGDLRDGGFAIFGIAGYTRLLGDAADTPLTALRGNADQLLVGAGLGYTF